MADFETKDSGERQEYASGMRRDIQEGKARFDLLLASDIQYESQFLVRFANLLERGAEKYGERNWELASSTEELARFKASALRHMMQWACGETDEDHAAAVAFNLMAYESIKLKVEEDSDGLRSEDTGKPFFSLSCCAYIYYTYGERAFVCSGCGTSYFCNANGRWSVDF